MSRTKRDVAGRAAAGSDEDRTTGILRELIDPTAAVPLYAQVAQGLVAAIESGRIPTGARLGNEAELSRRLRLSRPTMRKALATLVDRGLVVRRQGIGTVVLPTPVMRSVALSSLHDDLRASGRRPATTVLELDERPGSGAATAALGLPASAPLLHVRRRRLVDSEPLALMTNWFPAGLFPLERDELERESLYRLMRRAGVVPRVAWQTVGARNATDEEADLLDLPPGGAVLTSRRISYDADGEPVEFAAHAFAAGRYSFEMNLVAQAGDV